MMVITMKAFLIIALLWISAIIIFLAGFWCGKRVTEMILNSRKKKDKKDGDKN